MCREWKHADYDFELLPSDGRQFPTRNLRMSHSFFLNLSFGSSFFQSDLLDQWTQFLITDSLIPANQLSTDDFAGTLANQTNLAIKGIVGIKAMSVIAGLLGDSAKQANYSVSAGRAILGIDNAKTVS